MTSIERVGVQDLEDVVTTKPQKRRPWQITIRFKDVYAFQVLMILLLYIVSAIQELPDGRTLIFWAIAMLIISPFAAGGAFLGLWLTKLLGTLVFDIVLNSKRA
jgi:hypothetical protein